MRDNWCVGWSDRFTVAVWVGNLEGDSMRAVSGTSGAAPVWRDVMLALHARSRSEEHTSELQSLMRISYAVFCLQKTHTILTLNTYNRDHNRATAMTTTHN